MSKKSKKQSIKKGLEKKAQVKRERVKRVKAKKRPSFIHQGLNQAIQETKNVKGYLVTITQLHHEDEGGLTHNTFTHNFRRDDIFPSLEEVAKLLEPETKLPNAEKGN